MDEQKLSTQICKTPDELKASQAAEIVMLEGVGNNILEHLGKVELGRPIRIFLRNPRDEVVGGVIGNCFGGWVYIALLWVEKSLRNQGYGTRLMELLEAEAVHMAVSMRIWILTASKPGHSTSGWDMCCLQPWRIILKDIASIF